MTQRTLTKKYAQNNTSFALEYQYDDEGNFATAGITVDEDSYDNGTFIDRDYDVRLLPQISILLENLGPDAVKYEILSTTKNFDDLDADIADTDFTEVEKSETEITPGSSATGSVEVTGGPSVAATGTLTLVSAVANTFATGTITCASVQAGDTVTVNGLVYTAVSGAKADNTEFSIDTGDNETATDLADSITNDARTGTEGDVTATSSTDTVTCTTDQLGTDGNDITLSSSNGTRLAVSGATFSGGVDADVATINGLTYTAVSGTKADNTEFSIDTSDDAAATDLADSITNDTRTGTTVSTIDATATSSTNVVTVSGGVNNGADGNAVDIAGTTNITASAATLENGVTSTLDSLDVDGIELLDSAVRWRDSVTNTAVDVAAAINAKTTNPDYSATNTLGVVTITRVPQGPSTATVTSSTSTMTTTDGNFTGGAKGVSAVTNLSNTTPQRTAVRIRGKTSADGTTGKIRGDVKFKNA